MSSARAVRVRIAGKIQLEDPEVFRNATAVVGLDDVTRADALSQRIAEVRIEHIRGFCCEIAFVLKARFKRSPQAAYELSAEIREDGAATLRVGDHVTQVACPWRPEETGENIVPVRKIRK